MNGIGKKTLIITIVLLAVSMFLIPSLVMKAAAAETILDERYGSVTLYGFDRYDRIFGVANIFWIITKTEGHYYINIQANLTAQNGLLNDMSFGVSAWGDSYQAFTQTFKNDHFDKYGSHEYESYYPSPRGFTAIRYFNGVVGLTFPPPTRPPYPTATYEFTLVYDRGIYEDDPYYDIDNFKDDIYLHINMVNTDYIKLYNVTLTGLALNNWVQHEGKVLKWFGYLFSEDSSSGGGGGGSGPPTI